MHISAQPKPRHYTLLWQISGNGLQKPSYLFGTMHVKDRRVFNFSDSAMLALQGCSRFALEVQPDTTTRLMLNLLRNPDTLRSLDQLLSKKDYQKLNAKFEKKYGYPLAKANPMIAESLLEPDEDKPDDEVSFIDAYLYGIARTGNKTILGLEDASAQIKNYYGSSGLLRDRLVAMLGDDYAAESDEALEEMVKIYSSGNLNAIYKFATETGMLDSEIMARNKVMAASFEKYAKGSTLFAAVGAAHLPGPNGVLALLRRSGYKVRPVSASFTGVAGKYHIDYMKIKWPEYRSENMGFSAIFPGKPIKIASFAGERIVYYDIANSKAYAVLAFSGIDTKNLSTDRILLDVIGLKKYTLISKKHIQTNSGPADEIIIKTDKEWMRMRIITVKNILYCITAGGQQNKLDQPFINRYLNSFSTFPPVLAPPQKWIAYSNDTAAFRVSMPSIPSNAIKLLSRTIAGTNATFMLHLFMSIDTVNNRFYMIRYNDYPQGYFLSNKQALFNGLKAEFTREGATSSDTIKIWKQGMEGRQITGHLKNGTTMLMQYFPRGNRVYTLAEGTSDAETKLSSNDAFFKSFHFLPFIPAHSYLFKSDSGGFRVEMVSRPLIKKDSTKDYDHFLTHNITYSSSSPTSGGVYTLDYSILNPYFRAVSLDSLYQRLLKGITGYADSLIKLDTIRIADAPAREYLKVRNSTGDTTRGRIVVYGDRVFILSAKLDHSERFSKEADTIFNSLAFFPEKNPAGDIYASKAKAICLGLASSDTSVSKRAKGALSFYDFNKQELPYVYQALQKSYPDDTLFGSTREHLVSALKTAHDSLTIPFLTKLYTGLSGKDNIRETILNTITAIDKKTGYATYINLLTDSDRLETKNIYQAFNPLTDSIAMAAKYFDRLLPLMKYDNYRKSIVGLAGNMAADKKHAYDAYLRKVYPVLTAHAMSDLNNYLTVKETDVNNWSLAVLRYLNVMREITGEPVNDTFSGQYLQKDTAGVWRESAVLVRISNHLATPKAVIQRLLDSLDTRYDIMSALNDCHELNIIPLKYRQPEAFASLCLYEAVQDDDNTPQQITLLGSISEQGSVYYAFKFRMPDFDENAIYFGLAGPYQPGAEQLDFKKYHALTNYDKLEADWRAQAKKLIPKLLKADK